MPSYPAKTLFCRYNSNFKYLNEVDKTEEQKPKISMSVCIYLSHNIFNTGFGVISAEINYQNNYCFIWIIWICFNRF